MADALAQARLRAETIRFKGDVPLRGGPIVEATAETREKHYQNAIEISPELTPALWTRLRAVCERLNLPMPLIAAFIYSSPQVQAECLMTSSEYCTVRFSSALLDLLSEEEFEFVIGHEIAHFLLSHHAVLSGKLNAEIFVQQRSQEISADRLGLIACRSLETALRALMKTVSGLTEKHLRFDVAAFISQLRKIDNSSIDWSGSTHPSIVIRAKALLWLSLTEFLDKSPPSLSAEQRSTLDARVERDLQRFVDGAIKKQIEDAKRDVFLWMMTYEVLQTGAFSRHLQDKMRNIFGGETVDKLVVFIGGLSRSELDAVIYEKLVAARVFLEGLMPQQFNQEIENIRSRVATEIG